MEEIEKILKEEIKRLQRVNERMESTIDKTIIKDNASAICDIAKTLQKEVKQMSKRDKQIRNRTIAEMLIGQATILVYAVSIAVWFLR